ncbi:MAG: DUF2922 domain-containing protein [Tissierellaceae bacterium]|nr:DUF2922 domain-containing protein [Tissierellaceae bacterium]
MNKTKLELVFLNEVGKKFVVTMDNPREDLTSEELGEAMDEIIENNVFLSSLFDLVEPIEARVVTTNIDVFEV